MAGDYLIAFLLMAVLGVLVAGIVLMGIGGKANQRYGNKLMVARVSLQGLALLVLALLLMTAKK
ncbi:MAG: HIG1 domain-containing protein [Pseudomonadota bacterium]|nr:HIG1 domain-containing protein [Pseudomonadota bacterium]